MKKSKIPYLRRGNASLRVYLMRLFVSIGGAILLLWCFASRLLCRSELLLLQDSFFRRGFFCAVLSAFPAAQLFQPEFAVFGGFLIFL